MGLIKEVIGKVKNRMKAVSRAQRPPQLIEWKKKLEVAKAGQDLGLMDKREFLYLGDRRVDKNVNATTNPSKMSNNIYNIIYEFIETQVSSQIPMPQVKSKREGFDDQAEMIAESIANYLNESNISEINDKNERITPLQGFSIVEVCWNPDIKHHLYKGDIELYSRHPKQLVTQPKVYSLQKMDYFFILSDVTHDYVKRRYNQDLSGEGEQYPENTRLFDDGLLANNGVTQRSGTEEDEEPLTEIVCWYKDGNGDIGKYVWINDTVLEDLPQYFYRRPDGKITKTETLQDDVIIGGQLMAKAGEQVPYFIPTRYPVSIRINVPRNFAFGGQSDLDVVRDQQDSIKRVVHKMEEKLVKGGTLLKALDSHTTFNIDDTIYQIVRGSQQELVAMGTLDLTADISKDLAYVEKQYSMAQSMLGVTDSFQGKEDPTAQSGVAKQIQVQQASGRMQSKQFNKYVHYKEIFEIIFEFKMSLYDEPRPYVTQDANGQAEYGMFDKYQLLQRDKAGQLYYNTDFIFSSDGSLGLPKDPMFMYNQALALFEAQAMDATQLWVVLEALEFPQAAKILKQVQENNNLQAQMQQMQQQSQQDQQEIQVLNGMVQKLHGDAQEQQQNNLQSQSEVMDKLNQAQQMDHDHAIQQSQRQQELQQQQHQQGIDRASLMLKAASVAQAGRKIEQVASQAGAGE